ncbi:hypothetical protein phiGM223_13 [Pseudomonas phage phiGM22-3]|uniref:Uncharacterized protein n=1 Tax=Pseudomonas phage phiGM22-3 TaxID=2816462 RepID=A0A8T8IUX3_9CAUD|nr:hypothetical protein phiGM223_13 [Pseudomonas phage phiGM22-3]
MSEAQTTATVKLTAAQKLDNKLAVLFERITKDTEQYNLLLAERQTLEQLANIEAGFVVTFSVGKGETAKVVEARVLGVSEGVAKVTYGEGFDTTVATIKLAQVLSVVSTNEQPSPVADDVDHEAAVAE